MKTKYIHISIALLAMAFTACQREVEYDGPCEVNVRAYMQDEVSVTRSYTNMMGNLADYDDFTAELYVSNGTRANSSLMSKTGSQLNTTLRLENGTYWFHGYAPYKDEATCTATAAATMMTIPGVAGIGNTDLLLIKKETPLIINSTEEQTVALKMDHLMVKLTPYFYIDATYAQMRSIRIKKVEFFIDEAKVYTLTATYDLTASPVTYDVAWDATDTQALTATAYENTAPEKSDNLTQTKWEQAYGECYLSPEQPIDQLKMRVTYDVYDTEDVIIRADAVATNTILRLKDETLIPGTNYKLSIRVLPTYLYSLSDHDQESSLLLTE